MNIIEIVRQCLSSFPQLRYEFEEENYLTVYSNTAVCNIYIKFLEREQTLFFEKWHWHFENNEREHCAFIETLTSIISNRAKVKVFKRFGKPYRWDMELPGDAVKKKRTLSSVLPKWILLFSVQSIEYYPVNFL